MLALEIADETFAGIAAFYSIIHIPRTDVVRALTELRRVLKPCGLLSARRIRTSNFNHGAHICPPAGRR